MPISAQSFYPPKFGGLLILMALSGLAGAFAMAPTNFWPFILLGLGALFYAQHMAAKPWKAFILGWVFGFSYFIISLSWIGNALLVEGNDFAWAWPLAVSGLPALLAFFPALACYTARKFSGQSLLRNFAAFVALLSTSEWLRGHVLSGFPWNLYGYAWGGSLPMLQTLSLTNAYGLTALTIFWASAFAFTFLYSEKRVIRFAPAFISVLSMVLLYTYGYGRLQAHPLEFDENIDIRLVQPNINQSEKWQRGKMEEHFERLLRLSAPENDSDKTTYIVWPETALNFYYLDNPVTLAMLREMLSLYSGEVYLVSGALLRGADKTHTNSVIVLDKNAEQIARYDKSHLVPFGEYIPLQSLIPIETVTKFSGFISGDGPKTLENTGPLDFSPLVCYEILFPGKVINSNMKPAQAIINVTNDGWYGISAGPHQHLMKARFRAIEEGTPVIRAANTGISSIIDPYGRVIYNSELFIEASHIASLPKKVIR